jgi:hypothetical protein
MTAIKQKPQNTLSLDEYIAKSGLTNEQLAALVRRIRRHPSQPSRTLISHWRRGQKMPGHDMRLFLEIATGGLVSMFSWE